jgi:mono/diheme cytochrome c family protein
MKNFFLGILFTLVTVALAGFAYLRLGYAEVRADVPSSRLEAALLGSALRASIRRQAPDMPNPVAATNETLIAGGKLYLNECSGCHGELEKGKGGSPDALFPAPPQFSTVGTDLSESQIFWVTKHGIRRAGMFANGQWDADDKIWQMAAFLKRVNTLPPGVKEAVLAPKPPAAPAVSSAAPSK